MKKILWSTAAAALFVLTLTGCADNTPVQTEDRPQAATVISAESTVPVESEIILFSAGDELSAEDSTASGEPTTSPEPDTPAPVTSPAPQVSQPAEPSATPVPQETPPPVRITVTFEPSTGKSTPESETGESNSPAPSATPEPEPTPTATPPAQSEPPAASEPAFSIDYWITYAKNYAKGTGLNLDPTATGCWDNPITAGAHCTYLERDIQSRLNRYAKDDTILDVWIWAEPHTDGSYDLYIGYA